MPITTFQSVADFANSHGVTNLRELAREVSKLVDEGQSVHFVAESLQFDRNEFTANLLILEKLGQWETAMVAERRRRGIEKARAMGKYKRPRIKRLGDDDVAWMIRQLTKGEDKVKIAKELGVSRQTLYKYIARAAKAVVSGEM